ncbi:MAG: hypothetical protein ABIO70_01835 [Pseudomonadota bacterium]
MRPLLLLPPLLALGCSEDPSIWWLRGFGFGWTSANHRLAFMDFGVGEGGLDYSVIGGASSTGWAPDLPEGCEEDACREFRFEDSTLVDIAWGHVAASSLAAGTLTAEVLATPAGGTVSLEIPLHERGRDNAVVLLQGLTVDTDHPAGDGDTCFDPALGWHPRRIGVALENPTLSNDGHSVLVDLTATFEAGLSLEEYRACQDMLVGEEQVPVTVRALALASAEALASASLDQSMVYAWNGNPYVPDEQPPPSMSDRPLELAWDPVIAGWSAVDFAFMQEDEEGRGAYLRTLSVGLSEADGWASGHATNYSPGTQLSGFDYHFQGEVWTLETGDEVELGSASFEEVPAELDDAQRPVVFQEGWK